MQVNSAAWRGSQRGTGIPDCSEDMPGKSLNEQRGTWRDTLTQRIISNKIYQANCTNSSSIIQNREINRQYLKLKFSKPEEYES